MLKKFCIVLCLVFNNYLFCFADVIYLKNGSTVEGILIENGDETAVVKLNIGQVVFKNEEIKKVVSWEKKKNRLLEKNWLLDKEEYQAEAERKSEEDAETTIDIAEEKNKLEEDIKKEEESVKYIVEPAVKVPVQKNNFSSKKFDYKKLLGEVTLMELKKNHNQKYYLYLPERYTPDKKWPLFIGIHGASGNGRDSISIWKDYADKEGFILVCPNFSKGYEGLRYAADERLVSIIKEVERKISIDRQKILLAGFSCGAEFVNRFALKQPDYVNSAAIISAGSYAPVQYSMRMAHVKFLVSAGAGDGEKLQRAEEFVNNLKENNYQVKFKIFVNVDNELHSGAKEIVVSSFKKMKEEK